MAKNKIQKSITNLNTFENFHGLAIDQEVKKIIFLTIKGKNNNGISLFLKH